MRLQARWLLSSVAGLLAISSYAHPATSPLERENFVQPRPVAQAGDVGLVIAQGVRIPGVPETNELPLPPSHQQPEETGQEQLPMPPLGANEAPTAAPKLPTEAEHSFHVMKPEPLEKVTNLECVIERETVGDKRDPIYKIAVKLTLDDYLNVQDLTIVHHARSGAKYNRADQYVGAQLSQVPGHTDYTWTGTLMRNPSHLMKGHLIRTTDMRWAYSEQLFDADRLDYFMESACHVEDGSSKTKEMPIEPRAVQYYYVWDTRPPDNWLSLRTEASDRAGRKIAQLPNGTLLEVMEARPDNWWRVRPVGWNLEGWVLSRQGNRIWVYCCRSQ